MSRTGLCRCMRLSLTLDAALPCRRTATPNRRWWVSSVYEHHKSGWYNFILNVGWPGQALLRLSQGMVSAAQRRKPSRYSTWISIRSIDTKRKNSFVLVVVVSKAWWRPEREQNGRIVKSTGSLLLPRRHFQVSIMLSGVLFDAGNSLGYSDHYILI